MVESLVVDASVVAKWFNKGEKNQEESKALRDAWSEGKVILYAPDLLIFEVANSIWKNPGINGNTARSLARLVIRLAPKKMEVNEDISEEAMTLARRTKLTYYDAIYLALARSSAYALVTADAEQLSAADRYAEALHVTETAHMLKA